MFFGLKTKHRLSAVALSLFLIAHLINHLAGLLGQEAHIETMALLRKIYRQFFIELILLSMIAWQMTSGVILFLRKRKQKKDIVLWAQGLSGLYLVFFTFIHVCAVLGARIYGLDTDFRFAAAGMHVSPWEWFFVPYYFFAVFSLFIHVGCAVFLRKRNIFFLICFLGVGLMVSGVIVIMLLGGIYPVQIPNEYLSLFPRNF